MEPVVQPVGFTPIRGQGWSPIDTLAGFAYGAGLELITELLENNFRLDCLEPWKIGASGIVGAALSTLGPTGALLGRGGAKQAAYGYGKKAGLLNRFYVRLGWSFNQKAGQNVIRFGLGHGRSAKHFDLGRISALGGATPWGDGALAGMVAALFAHDHAGSTCCNE